ncbi:uncharacterized protein LOC9633890 isoform X2 [Selaginella moellendorffii]|uniref:uncharacterized protein LOC9633890 isoform X2 n=1 Tax=Selaginella moellendorffii TaxID=88036 RepID=UPI000D1CEF0F|nr:uncharacterized protein LOC9633890 isoform X2 [Selaginella moellendorffii]|eukprot:XP_024542529.1 uncharacterized protein LOC9633890 isoform X2 [Selaginella moellendorffii]
MALVLVRSTAVLALLLLLVICIESTSRGGVQNPIIGSGNRRFLLRESISASFSTPFHLGCPAGNCRSMQASVPHDSFAASDRLVPSGPDPLHHRIRVHN